MAIEDGGGLAVGVMRTTAVDVLCSTVFVRSVRSYLDVRLCVHPFSINWIGWVSARIRHPSHLPGAQKLLGGTHLKGADRGNAYFIFLCAHLHDGDLSTSRNLESGAVDSVSPKGRACQLALTSSWVYRIQIHPTVLANDLLIRIHFKTIHIYFIKRSTCGKKSKCLILCYIMAA